MTETSERVADDRAAEYAHILDDLHGVCRELAAVRTLLEGFAARFDVLDELLPAARRAAAMLDTPVTSFLTARREAASGDDQRAGPRAGRGRGPRAARRKLPHAQLR